MFHPWVVLLIPCEADESAVGFEGLLQGGLEISKGFTGPCEDGEGGDGSQQQWKCEQHQPQQEQFKFPSVAIVVFGGLAVSRLCHDLRGFRTGSR